MPGFVDTHRHMYAYAEGFYGGYHSSEDLRRFPVDWTGVRTKQDVLNQVKGLMDKYKFPKGKWVYFENQLSFTGGGGNAQSVYNQGVILWNQSKAVEAEAQFLKATQLDPKMAEAFYWLGMARVNQGKLPDAKAPFQEYMKLAPTGQFADQVKAKTVYRTQGSEVADSVAKGEAEIGITFTSEMLPNKGVKVVGTLPDAIQLPTNYVAAVSSTSANAKAAAAFIRAMRTAEGSKAIRAGGMEPLNEIH